MGGFTEGQIYLSAGEKTSIYVGGKGGYGGPGSALGGYRGGSATDNGQGGAGGCSSFILGFSGCDAVNAAGINTGLPTHFSGKVFTNASMLAGNQTMPTTSGGTSTGHSGSGYVRITYLPQFDNKYIFC